MYLSDAWRWVPKRNPKVSNRCVSLNYLKVSNECVSLKVSNRRLPLKYFSVLLVIGKYTNSVSYWAWSVELKYF